MNTFIAFSGGVDSTALALLTPDGQPVFTDTGWEFPELYAHIEKFESVTGREVIRIKSKHGSIPEYIRKSKFMPGHASRYCTRLFKIEPYNKFLKSHLPAELLIGLRADEPERVGNLTKIDGMTVRYPLREKGMRRLDCVMLCAEHDLLPRFPPYMARGGCIGCFYKRKAEVRALAMYQPEVIEELAILEEEVQDERGSYAIMFPNVGRTVRSVIAEKELFDLDETYSAAMQDDDVGVECGLFCNR